MKKYLYLTALLAFSLVSCNGGKQQTVTPVEQSDSVHEQVSLKYAQGIKLNYQGNTCLVTMQDPEDNKVLDYRFALVKRGEDAQIPEGYTRIDLPVRNTICMTSLQLSNFIKLNELEHVVGITSTKHLFNEEVHQRIKDGKIQKIGIEGNFDNEVILGINPDIIMISPFKRGGFDALKDAGIPLIPHLGYKELTPLGQAEWIKFVGLLLGEEKKATEMFDEIEKKYNDLKSLAQNVDSRPTVFSGELHGGNWYVVGGRSFLAQLFKDAGADYIFKDDNSTGGVNLEYELVYAKAAHAQYWRILNSHKGTFTYDALRESDARYGDFDACKNQGVIYCNMTKTPFYESMPVEPHLILADFLKIFHPELVPEHTPKYYSLLK